MLRWLLEGDITFSGGCLNWSNFLLKGESMDTKIIHVSLVGKSVVLVYTLFSKLSNISNPFAVILIKFYS